MEDAIDADALKLYLEPYGFFADSEQAWRDLSPGAERPELRLTLGGHHEMGNHTYYTIKCELNASSPSLELAWENPKRLAALREDLHDTVKNEMGKDYPDVFAAAPFAKRGGWGGTSERLKKWLDTLADAVNKGVAPPVLVFQVLLFFGAPPQSEHQKSAENVPEGDGTPTLTAKNEAPPVAPEISADLPAPVADSTSVDRGSRKHSIGEATTKAPSPSPSPVLAGDVVDRGDENASKEEADDSETDIKKNRSVASLLRGKSQPTVATPPRSKSAEPTPHVEELRKSATGEALEGLGMAQRRATSLGARPKDETVRYLQDYGYAVASKTQWSAVADTSCGKPVLRLKLDGHSEKEGHTYYNVKCHLFSEKRELHLDWTCKRRLGHLREELHDKVKDDLGKNYEEFFSQAPFARRGGLSGTTGRLQTWLETLASCVNDQNLSPSLVAKVLEFFGTPESPNAKCSTPRKSLTPQVWGDPLPEEMRIVRPQSASPSPEPPAVIAPSRSEPARSESPQRKWSFGRSGTTPQTPRRNSLGRTASPDLEQEAGVVNEPNKELGDCDDEEVTQFDGKKRQNGYRKLRDWFQRLRQSLSRSNLPCASSS